MPSPFLPKLSDQMLPLIKERFSRCRHDSGMGQALTKKALASFGIYTGWEVFHAFLLAHLAPGKYLLAGKGPASAALLGALQAPGSPIQIEGVIDFGKSPQGEFLGAPVLTPAEVAQGGGPDVIICNPSQEPSMVKALMDAGVPLERIQAVSSQEPFLRFHEAMLEEEMASAYLARILDRVPTVEHVILVPNRDIWSVVDEDCLREVLSPETTIRLYFGPPGMMDTSPNYETFDVHQCLPLILKLLLALRPISVYARGSAQFQSQTLAAALKTLLPEVFLTFEIYDYTCMFEDALLAHWSLTPETVEDNRNAEAFLGLRADFIIDKTPGEAWEASAQALVTQPRRSYYPTLGSRWVPAAPQDEREPGAFRILCAGSMPHFHNYRPGLGFPHWSYQNIIDPIVTLAKESDLYVDIFNASHDPRLDHWPAFGDYAKLFRPERVGYHARIPVQDVLERIPSYDFGMFFFAASEVPVDLPLQQSLPNRCMTYIAGNLPLIVNTEMACMAALVGRFNAGIALASTDMEALPQRIREADLPALRKGAEALHRHLVDLNQEAIRAFRACLSEHEKRVRQL